MWQQLDPDFLAPSHIIKSDSKEPTRARVYLRSKVKPIRRWSSSEDKMLFTYCKTKSNKELAEMIGRSKESIINRKQKLEITSIKKTWTKNEIQSLKRHFNNPKLSINDIAKLMNTTKSRVIYQSRKLGLKKTYSQ